MPSEQVDLTITRQTSKDTLATVRVPTRLTRITGVADILNWLKSRSLSNLENLDPVPDLDDDTCSFVASTFSAQVGHLREGPVVHHEVDVGHAEAGGIELDEDIFRAWISCQS